MAFVRLYRYKDKLILPTVVQAEDGFYMDVEPVVILELKDHDALRVRLDEFILRDNPVVPTPQRTDDPGSPILERLQLRKWRQFESEATMITIYLRDQGVEYYSTGTPVNGEWRVGHGKHISLPAETSNTKVVDLLMHELTAPEAADQPKLGGLALLPPPSDL